MRIRLIVLVLALLTFISASAAGYLFYYQLNESTRLEVERTASTRLAYLQGDISTFLEQNLKAIRILASQEALMVAVNDPGPIHLRRAEQPLMHFREALGADVCYLMDTSGLTIASSNRGRTDSFVGKNYAFRPYFNTALAGRADIYMARGVTSGKRGVYWSHPVFVPGTQTVVGVVAIKDTVDRLEMGLSRFPDAEAMLLDPHGLIFAASQPKWAFKTLWHLTEEQIEKIAATRQFGQGPWEWAGFSQMDEKIASDREGRTWLYMDANIPNFTGWRVVYLGDLIGAHGEFMSRYRFLGTVILVSILLIGLEAFLLYRSASRDITRRQKAEAALKEEEERFRSIVENSHGGIILVGGNFEILYANEEMGRILDLDSHELSGRDFRDFLPPASLELVSKKYEQRRQGDKVPARYEFDVIRSSGEKRRVEIISAIITGSGGEMKTVAQLLDITRRLESEEKYRNILESIEEGYFEIDLQGRFILFNESFCRNMGRSRDELMGAYFKAFMPPEAADAVWDGLEKARETGGRAPVNTHEISTASGEARFLELSASLVVDASGEPTGYRGVVRDVTQRRRAEEALRQSEKRYRTVLEANPDPVVVYDMQGRVTYFNPAFTEVFGYTLEESQGRKMDHFVPESALTETREMIAKVLRGVPFSGVETERIVEDGERIPVSISGASYTDSDGNLIGSIINIRDIRQRKHLEHQLQQAQKMEAVGTLASGIAHDFNNMLQAINGYMELIAVRELHGPDTARYLKEVGRTVSRASDLVQRLLTFSRKVKTELTTVDLNREVAHTVSVLERTIPRMIRIETRLAEGLGPIKGDPGQLEQVLMNLGVNAKDAMPDGGLLRIETGNAVLDEEFCRNQVELTPGRYVYLRVSDTGVGMDENTVRHIFEPFFTTKPVGEGTGLGLSTIYGIVKAHDGHVTCQSRPGEGTAFTVYLPAPGPGLAGVGESVDREDPVRGGQETILIVDDEPSVREIGREVLEMHGYRVIEADRGEEALRVYQEKGDRIDLVLMDLGMPGMGGLAGIRALVERDPNVRILIASGYTSSSHVRESLEAGATGFIGKPYNLGELLKRVRATLDGG